MNETDNVKKNREIILSTLDNIAALSARIRRNLEKEPGEVITYSLMATTSEAMTKLVYFIGMFNGVIIQKISKGDYENL